MHETDFESNFFETPETTRMEAKWEDCNTKTQVHDLEKPEEHNGSPAPPLTPSELSEEYRRNCVIVRNSEQPMLISHKDNPHLQIYESSPPSRRSHYEHHMEPGKWRDAAITIQKETAEDQPEDGENRTTWPTGECKSQPEKIQGRTQAHAQ